MTDIATIAACLRGRQLTEILVTGYIDGTASTRRFHPMFDDLYFDFDGLLLRASATDQFWHLDLQLVERIECRFQIEEGDEFGICPLDFVLRRPAGPHRFKQIVTFVTPGPDTSPPNKAICAALMLEFEGTAPSLTTLFLDPQNEFGIQLGTQTALAAWRQSNAATTTPAVEHIHPCG